MDAHIHREDRRTVTFRVVDNDDAEHELSITEGGVVDHHRCLDYPADEQDRTAREQEHTEQVRRFVKYHLWRHRDQRALDAYSTDDGIANPDRVGLAALVLATMSPERLRETLDTVTQQALAVHTGEQDETPISPPPTAPDADCLRVEQDLALALTNEQTRVLADALTEMGGLARLQQLLDMLPNRADEDLFAHLGTMLEAVGETAPAHPADYVEHRGQPRVYWETEGHVRVCYGEGTHSGEFDRSDVQIQLPVVGQQIRSPAAFQRALLAHLRCQVRDCYLGMGVAPPEGVRVRGRGIDAFTRIYDSTDIYQPYHSTEAIVDWTRQPPLSDDA